MTRALRQLPKLLVGLPVVLLVAIMASSAGAQQGGVVVFRIEPGAEALCSQVEQALSSLPLVPDPGYYEEAGRRGLDPASPQAMAELTPLVGVDLAVVPVGADATGMDVAFIDGRTGQSRGEISVPLSSGMLGAAGQRQLLQETRARLSAGGGGAAPGPAPGGATPGGTGGGYGAAEVDEEEEDEEEGGADDETPIEVRIAAGAGMGTRSVEWATPSGRSAVDLGAFPALDIGASLWFGDEGFALGTEVVYQSSFGHEVDEVHEGGSARPMAIRSHRVGIGLTPELRFGDDDKGVRLGLSVGYGVRSLRPAVHHLLTPDFSIGGPTARLVLHIPIGDDVVLALAPEGQLLMQVSDEFQELGVQGSGIAFGGDASLQIHLDGAFHMELTYRESHASLGSSLGDSASDVERYATARLLGVL